MDLRDCLEWTGLEWAVQVDCFGMDQIEGSFLSGELGFGSSESGNLGVTRVGTSINLEGLRECGWTGNGRSQRRKPRSDSESDVS